MELESENKIKQLEERVVELDNNWKRAVADYRNLERRTAEEQTTFAAFANQILLSELLPVLDALAAADEHLNDEGLKLALKKFDEVLRLFNVTEITVLNLPFDHAKMEAIEQIEGEKDKVIIVCEKGYLIGDKVLRPARVKVGKG